VTQAAAAGGILEIIAPEGATVPVGTPIARVGVSRAAPAAAPTEANGSSTGAEVSAPVRSATNGGGNATSVSTPGSAARDSTGTAVRATPLARRIAKAHGVCLEGVVGSGPVGRVTRRDVLAKAGIAPVPVDSRPGSRVAAQEPVAASAKGAAETVEPTRLQSVVARRMAEAKATIPHFQIQTDVMMEAAVAFRAQIKNIGASAPSFNDLIVKAVGLALREHPRANGAYRDGRFELYSRINIGIAVAAEHALAVPTIFDADQKSLGAIAADSRRLAERVRNGEVTPSELSGATFTVSNLGMYGMTTISPIVNPPQAAILGVGTIREALARVDGDIVDRRFMTLTLSCDHRILYGADAAEFLSTIRELVEQPLRLTL
jgi:pyruvate dehydrogenase E2 component (dihydrolipoamide acetyltransferase)